ncbi:MAG TPA: SIMPL domain-containing protein [Allosphingosinicella sp.]|jgi:hypothetical protein
MIHRMLIAAALLAATPALAQPTEVRPISGTRLDVVATGEVTRVPDTVLIHAGVSNQAPTATAAIRANGASMDRLRTALRAAGIEARDIQTSSINLNAEYRHNPNGTQTFTGYRASHQLSVRFRDAANAGRILDTLVTAGANEINGPSFEIADAAGALDEARTRALAAARARAETYARSLDMRVRRILLVSEAISQRGMPMLRQETVNAVSGTNIALGESTLGVTLTVSFELE